MKLLEKKRDELAGEYSLTRLNHMTAESSYIAGFDAAVKELEPVLKELVDAIKEIDIQNDNRCWYNVERICAEALQKYKQLIGEK